MSAAIPVYDKLEKIRLPRQGYSNILPKYASATGGEIFREFTKESLEVCLRQRDGRVQKPVHLGVQHVGNGVYLLPQDRGSRQRLRSSLKVYARDGYYPAPQQQ